MWRFRFSLEAEADFARLERIMQKRVAKKLLYFEAHFEETVPFPLGGAWNGFFKLRVGDWRIVYGVHNANELITVYVIDHRSQIYRRTPPRL